MVNKKAMESMESLIPVINKLQDVFNTVGRKEEKREKEGGKEEGVRDKEECILCKIFWYAECKSLNFLYGVPKSKKRQ